MCFTVHKLPQRKEQISPQQDTTEREGQGLGCHSPRGPKTPLGGSEPCKGLLSSSHIMFFTFFLSTCLSVSHGCLIWKQGVCTYQVKMRSHWIWVGLIQSLVSQEEERTQAHTGRTPCEDRGGDWNHAGTSQGTPMTVGHHRSWKRQKEPPLELTERAWPCPHVDLRLLASRTRREQISVVLSYPPEWYFVTAAPGHSPRGLITFSRELL